MLCGGFNPLVAQLLLCQPNVTLRQLGAHVAAEVVRLDVLQSHLACVTNANLPSSLAGDVLGGRLAVMSSVKPADAG